MCCECLVVKFRSAKDIGIPSKTRDTGTGISFFRTCESIRPIDDADTLVRFSEYFLFSILICREVWWTLLAQQYGMLPDRRFSRKLSTMYFSSALMYSWRLCKVKGVFRLFLALATSSSIWF